MHATERHGFIIALLITSILLSGCMGAVAWPAPIGETIAGMSAATKGAPGTLAMVKETSDVIVLGWAKGGGWSFLMVSKTGAAVSMEQLTNGINLNIRTAADFLRWLEQNGWQYAVPEMLPSALVSQVAQTSFALAMTRGSAILVLPIGIVQPNPLDLITTPDIGT